MTGSVSRINLKNLLRKRWVRFGIMGAIASASYYLLGLFFLSLLEFPLFFGNSLAYALSFFISFYGQAKWTFNRNNSISKNLPAYAITQIAGWLVNTIIIEILCNHLFVAYAFAMVIAIFFSALCTWFLCKFWVFSAAN